MFSLSKTQETFHTFLRQFDISHPKIAVKIRHTDGVVAACDYLAKKMNLSPEDHQLALLI